MNFQYGYFSSFERYANNFSIRSTFKLEAEKVVSCTTENLNNLSVISDRLWDFKGYKDVLAYFSEGH